MPKRREYRNKPIARKEAPHKQEDTGLHPGSEKLAPLFTDRQRQILRYYSPVIGRCDLTEEQAAKRDARDQALSKTSERRRRKRLKMWRNGVGLDKEARQALGTLTPPDAWLFIVDKATTALELNPEKAEQLANEMYLFDQPDDALELHDWEDLLEVITGMNPVKAINHFHYINPEFNLQKIIEAKPLDVLRAVLRIFTLSDRWLGQF